jgi:hypothetical protein
MGTNVSMVSAASIFKVEHLLKDEGRTFTRDVNTNLSTYKVSTPQNTVLLILPPVLYASETWPVILRQ